MKKGSKVAMIVVLLLVVVFGIGQFFASPIAPVAPVPGAGSGASTANTASATQVIAYAPSVSTSTPVKSGSCWTNSIAAPYRADAWRCAVGNGISDPCFQIPGSSNVACGVNPEKPSATFVLKLTKPLPAPQQPSQSLQGQGQSPAGGVWLVALADGTPNGTLCSPFTGTLPFAADGESANYGCAPGPLGRDVMIFGDLNASSAVWTAKIGTLSASTSTFPPALESAQTVNVKTVWQ